MIALPLFDEEPFAAASSTDIKNALRRRYPGETRNGMVGAWTTVEEYHSVDFLALNAWQKADVIAHEVKVSRADLRKELLNPAKRKWAVDHSTEMYFAVPAGLLLASEIAYEEPDWAEGDFDRPACERSDCRPVPPGKWCGAAYKRGGWLENASLSFRYDIHEPPVFDGAGNIVKGGYTEIGGTAHACCVACRGSGTTGPSRVERDAPTCWVPKDVGLITVSARGCHVVKPSPKRKDPQPIAATRQQLNDLVRWVSHRPDPRHR